MKDTQHITVVNLHTIIGGCIGAVSLFLPWIVRKMAEKERESPDYEEP